MKTQTTKFQTVRASLRAAAIALLLIGPLAGFAAAQDDGGRKLNGAGFVLYVSLMRG